MRLAFSSRSLFVGCVDHICGGAASATLNSRCSGPKAHAGVVIGSYPFMDDQRRPNTNIVLRSRDPQKLAAAKAAVQAMLERVQAAIA